MRLGVVPKKPPTWRETFTWKWFKEEWMTTHFYPALPGKSSQKSQKAGASVDVRPQAQTPI